MNSNMSREEGCDWGLCCIGCQCPRYAQAIRKYHPFFPGCLPPPHYKIAEKHIETPEMNFTEDPESTNLKSFWQWMPSDPDFCFPRDKPKWRP